MHDDHEQGTAASGAKRVDYEAALERCVKKLRAVSGIDADRAPVIGTSEHKWVYATPHDWVASFRIGTLWLTHELTGEAFFVQRARARDAYYEELLVTPQWQDHDLGFLFSLSCVADYKQTGNKKARDRALAAAKLLAARFVPETAYILAWDARLAEAMGGKSDKWTAFTKNRMIADTMQNLALLFWASQTTADTAFKEVALAHARTAAKFLVRDDGTSFHTFVFQNGEGRPGRGETHQGFADNSCWARGQAWLIHGFSQAYEYSGQQEFLLMAKKLAQRFFELLGDAEVPLWDLDIPQNQPQYLDSSAGAVAAAGTLLLARNCTGAEAARWRKRGCRLIDSLLTQCDLTPMPHAHGFLSDGAANVPAGRTKTMLPYGDYYFMEALMRTTGHNAFFW